MAEEMLDFRKGAYWLVLPYNVVAIELLPGVRSARFPNATADPGLQWITLSLA